MCVRACPHVCVHVCIANRLTTYYVAIVLEGLILALGEKEQLPLTCACTCMYVTMSACTGTRSIVLKEDSQSISVGRHPAALTRRRQCVCWWGLDEGPPLVTVPTRPSWWMVSRGGARRRGNHTSFISTNWAMGRGGKPHLFLWEGQPHLCPYQACGFTGFWYVCM